MLELATSIPANGPAPAAEASAGSLFAQIAPWLGLLVLVVIAGWLVILFVRRSMKVESGTQVGFTLEDLRRMHRAGEMTGEEFERAKSAMLANRPSRAEIEATLRKSAPKRGKRGVGDGPELGG